MDPKKVNEALDKLVRTLEVVKWADSTVRIRAQHILGRIMALPEVPPQIRRVDPPPAKPSNTRKDEPVRPQPREHLRWSDVPPGAQIQPSADVTRINPRPDKHEDFVPKRVRARIVKNASKSVHPLNSSFVKCACGAPVKQINMEHHLLRCPSTRGSSGQSDQSSNASGPGTSGNREQSRIGRPTTANNQVAEKNERLMDGSNGFAHARRENGRYGSPSFYDDYGEDSRP